MDKIKGEGGGGGGRLVWLGWGRGMGRKGIKLLLNNNKKFLKNPNVIKATGQYKSKSNWRVQEKQEDIQAFIWFCN